MTAAIRIGTNEPCPRCPEFVVRCGHLGEWDWLLMWPSTEHGGFFVAKVPGFGSAAWRPTRAEADAEFERREEALLA